MQTFNGRKNSQMLSDYDLSKQLNQVLEWAQLTPNVQELLKTVSARMEFADHNAPLVPQADRDQNLVLCFEPVENRSFMDSLQHHLRDAFCRDRTETPRGDFANKVLSLMDQLAVNDFHHSSPYYHKYNLLIKNVFVEYKPDYSDCRIICLGKIEHGTMSAMMIRRGDCYPFYIRFTDGVRDVTPGDFLFWNYNEVYRDITIDTVHQTVATEIHMYSAGKTLRYLHGSRE